MRQWRQTTELLRSILDDDRKPPLARLRILVHAFIRSECEEAEMRVALNDAAPLYRDVPEAHEAQAAIDQAVQTFMQEVLPNASIATRALASDLIMTTLSTVGKHFSTSPRTFAEIKTYSDAMADMFCAYLEGIEN
ncbi:TetR/AcrR family transcriptional regulator [Acerihabitans arboris]|uniref:TetR/AcrR family transcriptional regulator n=1 Tax=Acerihabitans arboris TaxID=2691583 RepID=A0A845SZ80_9GAMM|nr:TetR/AcrR family transcriptional regulator [Acerihabitans arboris]NDL66095.1 TetR/AcrR family transcriptional regulator [Acerihabitans arboris]